MKTVWLAAMMGLLLMAPSIARAAEAAPDYRKDVVPILNKYCTGCHNADDRDGELVMETYRHLMKGGENGAAIKPGKGDESLLVQVLTGKAKPKMPPKKKPAPSAEEIVLIKRWIDAGATGPTDAASDVPTLMVPTVKPLASLARPITALSWSPDGRLLAIGRYGEVEIVSSDKLARVRVMSDLPGKVNALNFSKDGSRLVAATGVNGLYGKAIIWNVATGDIVRTFTGHRDTMYDALLSPDGSILATCSYDRRIILWNAATGDELRTLAGHNDAVYDIAFSADGSVLASASGDQTVKVWKIATGERLDTLHQPTAEQFTVAFSPDDQYIVAGGVDNRIRVWRFVSREKEAINPLVHARFAHEGAITRLAFASDGKVLVSAAEDGTLKLWETKGFTQLQDYESQPDTPSALATWSGGESFVVGRMNGTLQGYPLKLNAAAQSRLTSLIGVSSEVEISDTRKSERFTEQEPNDEPAGATPVVVPAVIAGVIHGKDGATSDADVYRFEAKRGEQWMLEINAARSKSPLDSKIEVLDTSGRRIERVLLEAVRDSYFTFRGKDSNTVDDFRVFNWQEMELNDFLYADGEVVKLWHYPRGPDSGFMVYPGMGTRWGYYDTTPLAHALQAPCYIVHAHPPEARASLIPTGLPIFTLYYENDDDSNRRFGADSQLLFTAPRDGVYLARVTDVRGFHGPDYKYQLTIRPRKPDFTARIEDGNPTVNAGSGKEFTVKVDRIDGYDGPIRVDIEGVPPGFSVTTPIIVEPEQISAYGVISASPGAPQPTEEQAKATKVTATALINGNEVSHPAGSLGQVKLAEKPKLLVHIEPSTPGSAPGNAPPDSAAAAQPLELTIHPGETITARVVVERNGFNGRIEFGNADAGRNLPHGVYVDNIGLNGLLVVEGQNERTFFITAAKWVQPTSRLFFLRTKAEGTQTSQPVLLHVRPK